MAESAPVQPEVMDNRRKRTMRYIAVGSFLYLAGQGSALTWFLLLSESRETIAAVFTGLSPLMIATNAMFVSVVLGYMGAATTERYLTGKPG